jgi:hypothetical protein
VSWYRGGGSLPCLALGGVSVVASQSQITIVCVRHSAAGVEVSNTPTRSSDGRWNSIHVRDPGLDYGTGAVFLLLGPAGTFLVFIWADVLGVKVLYTWAWAPNRPGPSAVAQYAPHRAGPACNLRLYLAVQFSTLNYKWTLPQLLKPNCHFFFFQMKKLDKFGPLALGIHIRIRYAY